jgi:hypothetical protein
MNFKGFMVGNGATNWDYDVSPSFPETVYGFQLIPKELLEQYNDNGCVIYFNNFRPTNGTSNETCQHLFDQMSDLTGDLNWYDLFRVPNPIDGTTMLRVTDEERYGSVMIGGVEKTYKKGYTFAEYTPWLKNHPGAFSQMVHGDFVTDYINSPEVRAALHIPDDIQAFEECSDAIGANWHYQEEASEWIYKVLKANGIKMLHYSGDTDAAVSSFGTKRWIKQLNWNVEAKWRPWYVTTAGGKQVSGYIEVYEGLTFATVKGVGHMAPQWARQQVQHLITSFMHGEPI